VTNLVFSQNILNFALSKYTLHINILKKKRNKMQNFQITSLEDGKKYWISRSIATRSEVIVIDDDNVYLLINKRGEGTGRKKFHFAKTKRGNTMIVQEQKGTSDAKEMYHLVKKTKIKPRWDFEKTVRAINAKYIEKTFEKELQKNIGSG
jgi:hypothetical protein